MNRVFLSGKVQERIEVAYTPKGEKVVTFPLWVDEGGFSIDVVFLDRHGLKDLDERTGCPIMVSGVLMRGSSRSQREFRLKANNILWMEE